MKMNMKICNSGSLVFTLLISLALTVQAGGGMSEDQMQQMMKMQECMAKIDQSRIEALSARAEAMNKEVKALCAADKRDQAQDIAIQYGKEISASPEMQEMKRCGEMAKGMIQQMPMMDDMDKDYADRHVCDGM